MREPLEIFGIVETRGSDRKGALRLWQGRRVVDLAHAVFSSSLFELQAGGGGMGDDISSNGLRVVFRKAHAIRIRNDLVRQDDCDPKLFCESSELTQELSQLHLSVGMVRCYTWSGKDLSESSPRP